MPVEEREDFLDEDPEIKGQKIVLLSFISPESVLEKKEHYFFENFLKDYDFQWKTKNLEAFLAGQVSDINKLIEEKSNDLEKNGMSTEAETLRNSRIAVDGLINGFQSYVKKNMKEITKTEIKEAYDEFMFRKQAELEDKFYAMNDFKTTVRGLKVRGVYASQEEAAARARKLRTLDSNFNILGAYVGKWISWDPAVSQIEDHEYAEEQLNTLMQKYKENEDATNEFYRANKIKRPEKQFVESESLSESGVGDMFGATADLAMSRKMGQSTIEIVKDDTVESTGETIDSI
jgi:hypothetical protein